MLSLATVEDLRTGRIANGLIVVGLLGSLSIRIWQQGLPGFFSWIVGILLPVLILFLIFLIRGLGAGDIKLFSFIGSIWNLSFLFHCIILSFVIGGLFSLAKLIYHRNLYYRVFLFLSYCKNCIGNRRLAVYQDASVGKEQGNTIAFSLAILLGFFITLGVTYEKIIYCYLR